MLAITLLQIMCTVSAALAAARMPPVGTLGLIPWCRVSMGDVNARKNLTRTAMRGDDGHREGGSARRSVATAMAHVFRSDVNARNTKNAPDGVRLKSNSTAELADGILTVTLPHVS